MRQDPSSDTHQNQTCIMGHAHDAALELVDGRDERINGLDIKMVGRLCRHAWHNGEWMSQGERSIESKAWLYHARACLRYSLSLSPSHRRQVGLPGTARSLMHIPSKKRTWASMKDNSGEVYGANTRRQYHRRCRRHVLDSANVTVESLAARSHSAKYQSATQIRKQDKCGPDHTLARPTNGQ